MNETTTQPSFTVEELRTRPAITVMEAAAVLGIGRRAAYDMAATGDLPTIRCGRLLRVPTAPLLRMLEVSK